MLKADLNSYKKWFSSYVSDFYSDNEYINANLKLKEIHTDCVICQAGYIADGIGLGENDSLIAETIALFHDVGRFEQFARYRTYADYKSVNHSELAVEILKNAKILDNLPAVEQDIILSAILHHNMKELPSGLDEQTLLQSRLVRDADKLDIYRVLLEKYQQYIANSEDFKLELEHPDKPWYSQVMIDAFFNEKPAHYSDLKTLNDMKLLILAMVYDVNFRPTFKMIREKRYMQEFVAMLPQDETIRKVEERILSYIDRALAEN